MDARETQITHGPGGRILTNTGVWSPDGQWIVYDTRSDTRGDRFDGTRIERVHVEAGEVQTLYESRNGACCGVVTYHPQKEQVVFILGPEHPTPDWEYGPSHRQGVLVDVSRPGVAVPLDACDLTPPFTLGALRGGSHVHVFHPAGDRLSFTYNDAVCHSEQRNVGVAIAASRPVHVPPGHARNHAGTFWSVLATRTTVNPRPGSDEIRRAYEEGWVGPRTLAFLGEVVGSDGRVFSEVFVAELPEDWTQSPQDGPLCGTPDSLPLPPRGTMQRRLTFTANAARYPGVAEAPRFWLRAAPDGSRLAFLRRDDGTGLPQLWTVSVEVGEPRLLTRDGWGVASAFTWSPDGRHLAYIADRSVFVVDARTGTSRRLTPPSENAEGAPLPLACVFSPDGKRIAYLRSVPEGGRSDGSVSNQIFVVTLSPSG